MTPLDALHAEADAGEAQLRRYYAAFAAAELYVPLAEGGTGPQVIETEGQVFALAFDSEARLVEFAGRAVERAVMPGRALVAALAGQGAGIGLNLGVAESAMLLGPEALDWIAATASPADLAEERLGALEAPVAHPDTLALVQAYVSGLTGVAAAAWLARSPQGLVLAFEGVTPEAERGIAGGLAEALSLSGAGEPVAVGFDPRLTRAAARVGLRLEIPGLDVRPVGPPGSDPDRPPKLR